MAKYLCIIPARGGSKGVPRKNLRNFGGRPLITWSILHARAAAHLDRIVVTTDSEEIGDVARRAGAEVPFLRPVVLASDTATTESAMLHAVEALAERGYEPDAVVLLQATSPLRRAGRIDMAIQQFEDEGLDSLISVVPTHHFYWRQTNTPKALYDYEYRPRRQDIQESDRLWQENGSIYITRTDLLRQEKNRLCGRIGMMEMHEDEGLEIDSLLDFAQAETVLRSVPDLAWATRLRRDQVDLIALDFDGVLTDNHVLVTEDGHEGVWCNRSDGLAISELVRSGIPMIIVSTETNPVVTKRAEKLGLPVMQSVSDKADAIQRYCREKGYAAERTMFIGNDVNDLGAMNLVGWPISVSDGHQAVLSIAWRTLQTAGGQGVMREIVDEVLEPRFLAPTPDNRPDNSFQ